MLFCNYIDCYFFVQYMVSLSVKYIISLLIQSLLIISTDKKHQNIQTFTKYNSFDKLL